MEINITFVIQGVNFWICYCFLKKIFLKPIVTLLKKQEDEYLALLAGLKQGEQLLNNKETLKENSLTSFKNHIKQNYPTFPTNVTQTIPPVNYQQSSNAALIYKKEIKNLLVEKIHHAH